MTGTPVRTLDAIRAAFDTWQAEPEGHGNTPRWEFYGVIFNLRKNGRRWRYADVAEITGIAVDVLRTRMTDLRKMGPPSICACSGGRS